VLELAAGFIRPAGWRPILSDAQRELRDRLLARVTEAGREPPSVGELDVECGATTGPLLRWLEREGQLVPVEGDRYYTPAALAALARALRDATTAGRPYTVAELRDRLGISRKFLVPLLEYFDRTGVTHRTDEGRTVNGAADDGV
jgi:selenocysteine-specific elongation factor